MPSNWLDVPSKHSTRVRGRFKSKMSSACRGIVCSGRGTVPGFELDDASAMARDLYNMLAETQRLAGRCCDDQGFKVLAEAI